MKHLIFVSFLSTFQEKVTMVLTNCCANNIAGKILPRWLLDSKTLNGHFAGVLSFHLPKR